MSSLPYYPCLNMHAQLDWLRIAEWVHAGNFAVFVQLQHQYVVPVLDFSSKKSGVVFFICAKFSK